LTATLLAAGLASAGAGAAQAAVVLDARPGHMAPPGDDGWDDDHYHHRHHHPNCNNDPNSAFDMDPFVCTPRPPTH